MSVDSLRKKEYNHKRYMSFSKAQKEEHNRRSREWARRHVTGTLSGASIHKRPRPEVCELCGTLTSKLLHYHHWDNPSVGVWVCDYCHRVAEAIDQGIDVRNLANRYKQLRERVEKEWRPLL